MSIWSRWRDRRLRRRQQGAFPALRSSRLDFWRPPGYPMGPPLDHGTQREMVRQLVAGLAPRAIDEGTGEVLHNLVNAWADQTLAQVDADHWDHQYYAAFLVAAAAEEIARCEPQYRADLAEAQRAARAVAVATARLSGQPVPPEPSAPGPPETGR